VNGSGNAWTREVGRSSFGGVNRIAWRLLLTFVVLLGASSGTTTTAGAEPVRTEERRWSHPSKEYPRSVRRWFVDLPPALQYSEVRFKDGDDARWAQPEWDDADWDVRGFWDLPARAGVQWVRFRVRMDGDGTVTLPAGIMISTVRTYEVFWDGVLLGASGVPGPDRTTEQVGRVDEWFSIPAPLRGPGEHVVAMRSSSYRVGFPAKNSGFRFLVDAPARLQGMVLREAFVPTLAAGALCMVALAALIMWLLAARRATLLLLGGVCLAGAAMQTAQALRWFYHYPADWHYPVLAAMVALVGAQGVLTVALVAVLFAVPHRGWLLGGLVPVFALVSWLSPPRLNLEGVWILAVGMTVSLGCVGWALRRGRRGAWPALAGLAVSAVLLLLEAEDFRASFFMKFLPALIGLIAALALQLNDERKDAQAAQLAAARLETELLKKNLQPHFLLNTLAVLTEIVEQDPRSAVKLIDDLADEFRAVARVSAEKLIPLAQELELCRAHLRVMSARTGQSWSLEAAGVDETVVVPPAVLLTLIENGFTHQRVTDGATVFRLGVERVGGEAVRLTFFSPGEVQADPARPAGGTGMRYVRARLEESFPARWSLRSEAVAGGWASVIEIGTERGRA
jgi:hypothetical protein